MIYWGFIILASPLLAAIGSQLIYIALAAKIKELEKDITKMRYGNSHTVLLFSYGQDHRDGTGPKFSAARGMARVKVFRL